MMGLNEIIEANRDPAKWRRETGRTRENLIPDDKLTIGDILRDPLSYPGHTAALLTGDFSEFQKAQGEHPLQNPSPSANYKPTHGGYPNASADTGYVLPPGKAYATADLPTGANMSTAHDHGRATEEPVQVTINGEAFPGVYFEAVALCNAFMTQALSKLKAYAELLAALHVYRMSGPDFRGKAMQNLLHAYDRLNEGSATVHTAQPWQSDDGDNSAS